MSREYTYRQHSINDIGDLPLTILYANLGMSDEGLTLPTFSVAPQVDILLVRANQRIFITAENASGFTIDIGDVGDLPPLTFDFRIRSRESITAATGFYGDIDEAAEMSGLATSYMYASIQNQINTLIDARVLNGAMFGTYSEDEYHDVERCYQQDIVLRHCPVISITSIADNAQDDSPTALTTDDYVVDLEAGIIKLLRLNSIQALSNNFQNRFTRGPHSVRVQYTWGYNSVPIKVQRLATLMLARWAKINREAIQTGGVKAVRLAAGNYQETFDTSFEHIKTEYDDNIIMLMNSLRKIYAKGV